MTEAGFVLAIVSVVLSGYQIYLALKDKRK